MRNIIKIISGVLFGCIATLVFADAPVIDYSSVAEQDTAQSFAMPEAKSSQVTAMPAANRNFTTEQRLAKLEQQIDNVNNQNSLHRIEELQQSLQKINGKLEAQAHQIELLNQQLKDFYQDLNQRVGGTAKSEIPQSASGATTGTVTANANTGNVANTVPSATTASGVVVGTSLVPATAGNVANAFNGQSQVPAANTSNTNNDNAFLKEQQMYQTAIDLLPEKKHESENKLREYLVQYPKGVYAANAHYWLGDINFIQKNFDAAEEEFKIVIDKYAKSKRVADAMLKLALVHQNQGREKEAKEELQKIIKRYPGTSAAQLAKQQLATK